MLHGQKRSLKAHAVLDTSIFSSQSHRKTMTGSKGSPRYSRLPRNCGKGPAKLLLLKFISSLGMKEPLVSKNGQKMLRLQRNQATRTHQGSSIVQARCSAFHLNCCGWEKVQLQMTSWVEWEISLFLCDWRTLTYQDLSNSRAPNAMYHWMHCHQDTNYLFQLAVLLLLGEMRVEYRTPF